MFGQIPPTPYDLRFSLLGIPVRVHPVFWLTSLVLAWTTQLDVVIVRVLCIFVAIVVHEMGHALVTRSFGWQPEIVLYILGGYATTMRHSTWKDIAVSAAGPAAGFLLFFSIWWWGRLSGMLGPESTFLEPSFDWGRMVQWPEFIRAGTRANLLLAEAVYFTLFISLIWNVMNLVPVLPLDGGQISRELCTWANPRKGMEACLLISVAAGGAVALWAVWAAMRGGNVLGLEPTFLALMFGYLAFQSYQAHQGARRGYD